MKARESGMPDESLWVEFYDPECILSALDCTTNSTNVVEFGCGYGTFTIPAARRAKGTVYALDIDTTMIEATEAKIVQEKLTNIEVLLHDFVAHGSGRPSQSVDYVMLFNILHIEDPVALLRETYRILVPGGKAAIIHWNYDPTTPRGPSLAIRPKPKQCAEWAEQAGFQVERFESLKNCCAYHWGMVLLRPH